YITARCGPGGTLAAPRRNSTSCAGRASSSEPVERRARANSTAWDNLVRRASSTRSPYCHRARSSPRGGSPGTFTRRSAAASRPTHLVVYARFARPDVQDDPIGASGAPLPRAQRVDAIDRDVVGMFLNQRLSVVESSCFTSVSWAEAGGLRATKSCQASRAA